MEENLRAIGIERHLTHIGVAMEHWAWGKPALTLVTVAKRNGFGGEHGLWVLKISSRNATKLLN